MVNMGWRYSAGDYSANNMGAMGLYLGMDQGSLERDCDKIISKTQGDLGDAQIYYEWQTDPTTDQLEKLDKMIKEVLGSSGSKYKVTNRN